MPTTYAIIQGNKYMDATTYTGNGGAQTITNAGSFKPDAVWMKLRSGVANHILQNSVTGVTKGLQPNLTDAEFTDASTLTAFNSNGFSLNGNSNTNGNGSTYVAWQWQAGQGTTSNNTSGTITSTVSANTTAGFSIVTYTGNGTSGATFGHGLGVAPSFVIFKSRSAAATYWLVYSSTIGNASYLSLQTTDAAVAGTTTFLNSTTPTSSLITLGNGGSINSNGATYVAYCWTPIAGFSAFGSYTGNGSADGPFIYTGFRPKYVLWKVTSTTGNWVVADSSRDLYNPESNYLIPNTSGAEGSATLMDFLSNGFKLRTAGGGTNGSGENIIYAAFAETPFKYANAR